MLARLAGVLFVGAALLVGQITPALAETEHAQPPAIKRPSSPPPGYHHRERHGSHGREHHGRDHDHSSDHHGR